jgi:hypothetical protein
MAETRPLFFFLARDDGALVLVDDDGRAPQFAETIRSGAAFDPVEPYNRWFQERYGIAVRRIYAIDRVGADETVFVLEPVDDDPSPARGAWARRADVRAKHGERGLVCAALDELARADHRKTMPWTREQGSRTYLSWAEEMLGRAGEYGRITAVDQVKNTYVGDVVRLTLGSRRYFVKNVPYLFVREITAGLHLRRLGLLSAPEWVAHDERLRCVLMRDMGGCDLTEAPTHGDAVRAVQQVARLQQRSAELTRELRVVPAFRDYRLSQLSDRARYVAAEARELLDGSPHALRAEEVHALAGATERSVGLCRDLASSRIPDVIDHGDLRPGNVRIVGSDVVVYDWAWPAIAHPFIGAAGLVRGLAPLDVREAYLEAWSAYGSRADRDLWLGQAEALSALLGAVADADWVRELKGALGRERPRLGSADGWTLDRREHDLAKMLKKIARGGPFGA